MILVMMAPTEVVNINYCLWANIGMVLEVLLQTNSITGISTSTTKYYVLSTMKYIKLKQNISV